MTQTSDSDTNSDTDFYQGSEQLDTDSPITEETATSTQARSVISSNLDSIPNTSKSIVTRKMSLEEAKFRLEESRANHDMFMELRREDFRERQILIEQELNNNKSSEHWMKAYWRPAMGWLYMVICAFDFIIGPVLSLTMPAVLAGIGVTTITYTPWESLTLSNGGLIHLAFGAILGVAAWTRGQEKINK